jgi:hypothetical protein
LTPENNLYYGLTQSYYPNSSYYQINQRDCTNDKGCIQDPDSLNLYPVKQSATELLPIGIIGQKEQSTMNNLSLSIISSVPMPIESPHNCPASDVRTAYDIPTQNKPEPTKKDLHNNTLSNCNRCDKTEYNIPLDQDGNILDDLKNAESNHIKKIIKLEEPTIKEGFGLFEQYRMSDYSKPLYYNAPDKNSNICSNCTVGYCRGDQCTGLPFQKFKREDPLDM